MPPRECIIIIGVILLIHGCIGKASIGFNDRQGPSILFIMGLGHSVVAALGFLGVLFIEVSDIQVGGHTDCRDVAVVNIVVVGEAVIGGGVMVVAGRDALVSVGVAVVTESALLVTVLVGLLLFHHIINGVSIQIILVLT